MLPFNFWCKLLRWIYHKVSCHFKGAMGPIRAPVPRDQEAASWEVALSTATSGHHVGLFDLTEFICHDAHYSPLPECSWLINGSPELPKARTGLAGRRAGAATGLCLTHGVELSVRPSFCLSVHPALCRLWLHRMLTMVLSPRPRGCWPNVSPGTAPLRRTGGCGFGAIA